MRALYCGTHKQDGMVNVDQERRSCNRGAHLKPRKMLEVVSPQCFMRLAVVAQQRRV